jgi:hemolysin activation/secretion protein
MPPVTFCISRARRLALMSAAAALAAPAAALAVPPAAPPPPAPIERNLPPAPEASETPVAPPNALPASQDATPIGPALSGIVVLTSADGLAASPGAGVDVSRAPRLADDKAGLAHFLGRPLSRKLIAQIEAEIARHYRDAGFPFVNLSTPEQDIGSGVLQVRALEFRLGVKKVRGAHGGAADYELSRVRLAAGDDIDANQLAQDLDWLNRYPFRHVAAQFSPGVETGLSDLTLQTTTSKPWSAYVGYANSGSPQTGEDRYIAGVQVALPGLPDAFASYQFTASNDALFDGSELFHAAPDPRYVSDAGRIVVPTLPRQDIEVTLDYVRSNQPVQVFASQQTIEEATLAYRAALSDFVAALPGEAVLGFEAKRDKASTRFGGAEVASNAIDVFQATVGYADQADDRFGRFSGEATLHISPGGLNHANSEAAFAAFSNGADTAARYAYVAGDLTRFTRLPRLLGLAGFSLVDSLSGQYAAAHLPQTEAMGVGGAGSVRGYTLDDGAFDTALVLRNELRAPSFSLLHLTGRFADQASPYLFVDTGYGRDHGARVADHMASTGLALDYQLGAHLSATLDGAWALRSAGLTKAGDARLESRVTISF